MMKIMKVPRAPMAKMANMKMSGGTSRPAVFQPFGKGSNSPIVDDSNFTDSRPTLGGSSSSFNPGSSSSILPTGPPKFVGQRGNRSNILKGVTNKRY